MIELYELNPYKMTTPQEKAQCVSWFIETKFDGQTQRNYRSKYRRDPPSCPSICLWHNKFMETGTLFDTRRCERLRTSEENIERVRQAFQRSPMKSIRTVARQLELPRSTVLRVSSMLTSVVSLGLNIWFCLDKPGHTLHFFLRSSRFMGVQFI